jgi:DNA-binding response OmpR family regulator
MAYISYPSSKQISHAEWLISDTGRGISPEQKARIFDRFYQGNNSDTRDREGTGIGLALTKELIDLCRGEITVESEPGQGSRFLVRLPVSREAFHAEEIAEKENPVDPGQLPYPPVYDEHEMETTEIEVNEEHEDHSDLPVILVVEDNDDLTNYISGILENNHKILTAGDGKKGFEIAVEAIPDLVISDVMMPVTDGMEMCRQLKSDERTSHIPVIMLTAKADRDSKLEGLKTGADDYILKPFDAEELQLRVRNMLEHHEKLREKFKMNFLSDGSGKDLPSGDSLLENTLQIMHKRMAETDFNIDYLTDELNMSRSQLYRKIRSITGSTPNGLLLMVRMKHSAMLLKSSDLNITQVMYEVGLRNPSHFAASFREFFGVNPSEYKSN